MKLFNKTTYDDTLMLDIWDTFDISTIEFLNNEEVYTYYQIDYTDTLLNLSKYIYNDPKYIWILLLVNQTSSPFDFIKDIMNKQSGLMKALKPIYVNDLIIEFTFKNVDK